MGDFGTLSALSVPSTLEMNPGYQPQFPSTLNQPSLATLLTAQITQMSSAVLPINGRFIAMCC